ncbi:hypothetical protein EV383_0133 [Pseudonocardia sediminis]|uniref:DNA-binding transcriptional regulator of glucitol operon n=1 Tax=Pseudonocardia sediminis TaxID=1397368 RepID=A0A4Q7UTL1_PSEST|nr:hypothetical protein EV383_0133 [Pseudonocardia sediminis]
MARVLRLVLSPRWIAWHLLTLGAMTTCAFLAIWQWGRAGSAMGSALNVGYGLQWPLFALFFAFFWWHFLHMEVRSLRDAEGAMRTDEAAGTTTGDGAGDPGEPSAADEPVRPAAPEKTPEPDPDRPSPFGPRPAGVDLSRLSDPQIRAYNDELAKLNARNQEH